MSQSEGEIVPEFCYRHALSLLTAVTKSMLPEASFYLSEWLKALAKIILIQPGVTCRRTRSRHRSNLSCKPNSSSYCLPITNWGLPYFLTLHASLWIISPFFPLLWKPPSFGRFYTPKTKAVNPFLRRRCGKMNVQLKQRRQLAHAYLVMMPARRT